MQKMSTFRWFKTIKVLLQEQKLDLKTPKLNFFQKFDSKFAKIVYFWTNWYQKEVKTDGWDKIYAKMSIFRWFKYRGVVGNFILVGPQIVMMTS